MHYSRKSLLILSMLSCLTIQDSYADDFDPPRPFVTPSVSVDGVNLTTLDYSRSTTDISIGVHGARGSIEIIRTVSSMDTSVHAPIRSLFGHSSYINYDSYIQSCETVVVMGRSYHFDSVFDSNGHVAWVSADGTGEQLDCVHKIFTARDGTLFSVNSTADLNVWSLSCGSECVSFTDVKYPDGTTIHFDYEIGYTPPDHGFPTGWSYLNRIRKITSSLGYSAVFHYLNSSVSPPAGTPDYLDRRRFAISEIDIYNDATCPEILSGCPANGLRQVRYTYESRPGTFSNNDGRSDGDPAKSAIYLISSYYNSLNKSELYTYDSNFRPTSITLPEQGTPFIRLNYDVFNNKLDINWDTGTAKHFFLNYNDNSCDSAFNDDYGYTCNLTQITDSNGNISGYRIYASGGRDYDISRLASVTDEIGNKYNFKYDDYRRLIAVRAPEGNYEIFSLDSRGNATSHIIYPKILSTLVPITTSYYFSACNDLNYKWCNKPQSITDALGYVKTYTYKSENGELATETEPADANGIQPVRRYNYVQRRAWISNGPGGYTQVTDPVWLLSTVKTCRTTATVSGACVGGTADEVVTTYEYGPDSGPNNLLLRGKAVTADGATLRTCYTYDSQGNKISETSPRGTTSPTVCP